MSAPSLGQTEAYYKAALLDLRDLEAREARGLRFSNDADAHWRRFRGKLHDGDRLQMLLRDASATWGLAFAASHISRLEGVALDEPLGASWTVPNASQAQRYLQVSEAPPSRPAPRSWASTLHAMTSTGHASSVVADLPAHRQLAGLANLFVGAVKSGS